MSILIKGMDMPKSCMNCPFKGFDRVCGRGNICSINESITFHAVLDGLDVKFVRKGDCPLVEVPPHGRLIDADAFIKSECNSCDGACESMPCDCLICDRDYRCDFMKDIANASTVIKAEEGE